jgi:hypothetical protein
MEGRITGVLGDTLQLRVDRWRAGGWTHDLQRREVDVAVVPAPDVTVEQRRFDGRKTTWLVLGTLGGLAAAAGILFIALIAAINPS